MKSLTGRFDHPVIPGCDGAGVVEAVGPSVTDFKAGDRVLTHISPTLAEKEGDDAITGVADAPLGLGMGIDGTLRSWGVFSEKALVHSPKNISFTQAATMTCTWVTAWTALFGISGRAAGPGSWVLVQGTGGVSIATLQVAIAAGAQVVATTSTEEKASRLKALGATHVVNYRENPEGWGKEARSLTPEGRGFDIVVVVGGDETLPASLDAVRKEGVVTLVGAVGDASAEPVPMFAAFFHTCIVRGLIGASRTQMKEVVQFVEEKNIQPVVDDVEFELAEAKGAYRRLSEKKHFSKVVIRIDH